MRTLKVQQPPMIGADVLDWRRFLIGRGSAIDASGSYDGAARDATRDYQSGAGLGADGVMGPLTFSRAVRLDGFTSDRPYLAGMDASANCSTRASEISADALRFVARYFSTSSSKVLRLDEARVLSAAGLKLLVVYEDRNDEARHFTADIGTRQANEALRQAAALGQPAGSAIYFAVDFDATSAEVRGPVSEYFHAVNLIMSGAPFGVGVYGSGLTCRIIRDAGMARFAWLAGSSGFAEFHSFRPRAHILQVLPSRKIASNRLNIDDDVAQSDDFGAFQIS